MSLSHEEAQEALLALEDGEPSDDVLAHLETCAECAGLRDALFAVDAQLAALEPIEPPPELIERTLAAVAEERAPAPSVGVFGLFGAIALGLFGGLWSVLRLLFAPLANKKVRIGLAVAVPALGALAMFVGGSFLITADRVAPVQVATPEGRHVQLDGPIATTESSEDRGVADELAADDGWGDLGGQLDLPPGNHEVAIGENRRTATGEGRDADRREIGRAHV